MIKKILEKKKDNDEKVSKKELEKLKELKTDKDKTASKKTTNPAPKPIAAPVAKDPVKDA